MSSKRVLIAGIGNIFFGDDAFGVEVAQRLLRRGQFPAGVRVVDFGIRSLDLAFELLDDYDNVILIDAAPRGGSPGDLYLILEPEIEEPPHNASFVDSHGMDPVKVLQLAQMMGAVPKHVMLVACEPTSITSEDDIQAGLSEPVRAAVEEAVGVIDSLLERILPTTGQDYPNAAVRAGGLPTSTDEKRCTNFPLP